MDILSCESQATPQQSCPFIARIVSTTGFIQLLPRNHSCVSSAAENKAAHPQGRGLFRKEPIRTVAGGRETVTRTGRSAPHSLLPILQRSDPTLQCPATLRDRMRLPWGVFSNLPLARCATFPAKTDSARWVQPHALTARHSRAGSTRVVLRQANHNFLCSALS